VQDGQGRCERRNAVRRGTARFSRARAPGDASPRASVHTVSPRNGGRPSAPLAGKTGESIATQPFLKAPTSVRVDADANARMAVSQGNRHGVQECAARIEMSPEMRVPLIATGDARDARGVHALSPRETNNTTRGVQRAFCETDVG